MRDEERVRLVAKAKYRSRAVPNRNIMKKQEPSCHHTVDDDDSSSIQWDVVVDIVPVDVVGLILVFAVDVVVIVWAIFL